jgi:hypothetical protein
VTKEFIMKKLVHCLLLAFTLSLTLVGCSSPPDDSTIETLVAGALKSEVHPLAIGNMLGGSNATVEEFEILDKSRNRDEPNAISAAFGAKPQNYWLVEVRVKGSATVGGSDAMSAMFSGGSVTRKDFDARMKYKFFQNEDESWYTKLVM